MSICAPHASLAWPVSERARKQTSSTIRALYRSQCDAMLAALRRYMPDGTRWSEPEGGMFTWVSLPEKIDTTKLLGEAVKRNVAFVPSESFFANEGPRNMMRLSFVTVPPAKIDEGIATLAALVHEWL